jgi:hypothetical protein
MCTVAHYRKFLQKVVDTSSEFTEVAEILTRYETLKAANSDLVTKSSQVSEDLQRERVDLNNLVDVNMRLPFRVEKDLCLVERQ